MREFFFDLRYFFIIGFLFIWVRLVVFFLFFVVKLILVFSFISFVIVCILLSIVVVCSGVKLFLFWVFIFLLYLIKSLMILRFLFLILYVMWRGVLFIGFFWNLFDLFKFFVILVFEGGFFNFDWIIVLKLFIFSLFLWVCFRNKFKRDFLIII